MSEQGYDAHTMLLNLDSQKSAFGKSLENFRCVATVLHMSRNFPNYPNFTKSEKSTSTNPKTDVGPSRKPY